MEKTITYEQKEIELYNLIDEYIFNLEYYIQEHYKKLEYYKKHNDNNGVLQETTIINCYNQKIEKSKQRIKERKLYYSYLFMQSLCSL